ncbi:hypothetical protein [Desulfatitalea alkaliphila]|uniref:Contractile injection system tube protein N-terminal domain-containing protein n=1 Tax=Desulfatitalea alkaliphila TaxID=2929485 RepID=A0AA41R6R2_9BACT|nr:hypothetical protein [Desulfatitalea alkaliphila]MCJ8500108.1 hypothetical protein [Desulfatitalea alkaliphila]
MTTTASDADPAPRGELRTTACFMPKTDENGQPLSHERQRDNRVTVHFNPESLDITFTNSVRRGQRNQPAQVTVTETTAALSMELLFDTTLNGVDVRTETNQLARMMDPAQQQPRRNNRSRRIPSIVIFQWGTLWFEGYIDNYKEKLEFFSDQGVPLRATVTLSMTQQQRDFEPNTDVAHNTDVAGDLAPGHNVPAARSGAASGNAPVNPLGADTSVTRAVAAGHPAAGGDSAVARYVAATNGIENMRLPEVGELVLPDVRIFAGAGGSPGAGAGNGVQVGGETAARFAALKPPAPPRLRASVLFHQESHFAIHPDTDTPVFSAPGTGLQAGLASSMSADVGVGADLKPGITFED